MSRHIRRFEKTDSDGVRWTVTFAIKVWRPPNGVIEMEAKEHIRGQPLDEYVPPIDGEDEMVADITRFLEKHHGPVQP